MVSEQSAPRGEWYAVRVAETRKVDLIGKKSITVMYSMNLSNFDIHY
jgi:hypothetical protein